MSFLLHGLHPTFDALSTVADQSDVDAARTRACRHVAQCATCAATVAEIRAMGEGARAVELPGAPAGLWEQIQRAAVEEQGRPEPFRDTPAPDADHWKAAPALRPTTHVPSPVKRVVRVGAMALAAAAVVLAVLLLPLSRDASLQAGPNVGRWRFSPEKPTPGSAVSVRFEPAANMALDTTMLLLGGDPWRMDDMVANAYAGTGLQDSLGVLRRSADGGFDGRFTLPATSMALVLRLARLNLEEPQRVMSTGGPLSRTPEAVALLVAGDGHGGPSLAALSAAAQLWGGGDDLAFSVADTLVKYFPAEPLGHAIRRRAPSRRLLDDLIAWFKRGERQYLKFDERYMAQRAVSADRETAMIIFANRIAEPGEVRKWTFRLVREHPADPRSLYLYSSMLAEMLNRTGTVDSVRRALPLADSLWTRSRHAASAAIVASVATTVGDTAARRRWVLRGLMADAQNFHGSRFSVDDAQLVEPAVRRLVTPVLRARVATDCARPAGQYPIWRGVYTWAENCELGKGWAYSSLSLIERLEGRPRAALALADSAIARLELARGCGRGGSAAWNRGLALLDLGDTAAALPALARGVGYGNWQSDARRDAMGARLRPSVSAERWTRQVDAARADFLECTRRPAPQRK